MENDEPLKEQTDLALAIMAAICNQYARSTFLGINTEQLERSLFAGFEVTLSPVELRSRAALHAAPRTAAEQTEWSISTLKYVAHRVLVHAGLCQDTFEDLVRISRVFDSVMDVSLKQNIKVMDALQSSNDDAPSGET